MLVSAIVGGASSVLLTAGSLLSWMYLSGKQRRSGSVWPITSDLAIDERNSDFPHPAHLGFPPVALRMLMPRLPVFFLMLLLVQHQRVFPAVHILELFLVPLLVHHQLVFLWFSSHITLETHSHVCMPVCEYHRITAGRGHWVFHFRASVTYT
jgi:hypothetical protein